MTAVSDLARFDDRWTMRHSRTYPHPIERVWEAITTSEHLNRWLLPRALVEPVDGGRCSFTWGGDVEQVGVVRSVSPPTCIVYDLDTSYLRFELTSVDGGTSTRLDLVHGFAPGAHVEPVDRPGGDQPAGPDSPWRPDFSQGFHLVLDDLGAWLDGRPKDVRGDELIDVYRTLIREECPS